MKITWYGTASLSIQQGQDAVLFDPFVLMNENLPAATLKQFALFDHIFLTHSHFDHMIDVPAVLALNNATVYCSRETAGILLREGVEQKRIALTGPGAVIKKGAITIGVLRGRHITFDLKLVLQTLFSRRAAANFKKLKKIYRLNKLYPAGEVFIYKIEAGGKTVLHLGSLALDPDETYPTQCDLLTIPYQGRSDLERYATEFIETLNPKALYLHHFDDAFPPVSSPVKLAPLQKIVAELYPRLPVFIPAYQETIVL